MSDPGLLEVVSALREHYGRIVDAAREGESPSLDRLEQHARELDALIRQLEARERRLDESSELLANRINNLLMAVQTTADYLAATRPGPDFQRLRQRLVGTIDMGKAAFEEVLRILLGLR